VAPPTLLLAVCALYAAGQAPESEGAARPARPIQDNSFLIEEAYNQEKGVVQHIQQFLWNPSSGNWLYTFTQEWPVGGVKHQLSYTLAVARVARDAGGEAAGFGDVILNYRYQLVGDADAPVAMAPRLSLILPTGSSRRDLGSGGVGAQVSVPVSVLVGSSLQANGNVGATWIPGAKNERGEKAGIVGVNLGGSLIWLARAKLNFLLEAFYARAQTPSAPGQVRTAEVFLLSPGVRWAYNFASGLQIVPGVAVPIGVGPSHDRSVLVYLSFEHPFTQAASR